MAENIPYVPRILCCSTNFSVLRSTLDHLLLCKRLGQYLTPCDAWLLVGHRNVFVFLSITSANIQIGRFSSSCYLFSCSAMLDKSFREAIVIDLYLTNSQRTTAFLRSPAEVGKYWMVVSRPSVTPSYLIIFNTFSFAHSNTIKSNPVTYTGIIISAGSLRNEEKSIS